MTSVIAIDPGTRRSAWVLYQEADGARFVRQHMVWDNEKLLEELRHPARWGGALSDKVLIEKIESYGMAVGEEVFTTVMWVGRFIEALHPTPVILVPRKHVKLTLCGSMRAKDPNIRQALIDRFGEGWKGTKAAPGPLYGIAGDEWSALAVAVAYAEAPL